jgi:hypothetical protein
MVLAGRTRSAIPVTLSAMLGLLIVLPVIILPYGGDDVANHLISQLSFSETFDAAIATNEWWIRDQGRFFPTAQVYAFSVWHVFPSTISYHIWIATLLVALLCLVSLTTYRVTGSPLATLIVFALTASGLQFRYWTVDGVSNMGGLVILAAVMSMVACLLAYQYILRGHYRYLVLGSAFWFMAITTYEITLLMLPALLLLLASCSRMKKRLPLALTSLLVPTAIDLLIVLTVRSRADPTKVQAEWRTNLDGPVFETSIRQFFSALPSSQFYLGGAPGVPYPWLLASAIALILGVPLATILYRQVRRASPIRPGRRVGWVMAISGMWIWLVPAIMVGTNGRWQTDLPEGQGYIYTFYASIGVALVVGGLAMSVLASRSRWGRVVWPMLLLSMSILLAAGSAAVNIIFAQNLG